MTDTLDRLVGHCLLGSFRGTRAPSWLLREIERGLGGVVLFAGNIVDDEQVGALIARLRSADDRVVVAIDEEGGDVTRLDATTGSPFPGPAALGFVDDVGLTTVIATELGARLHDIGIDMNLAPIADINSNRSNPIIGVRAFGSSAPVVSRHVVAYVDGLHAGGVAACVKHFPGHGDTSADTHLGTVHAYADRGTLASRELRPFAAAVAAGVDAVMTTHVIVDAVDSVAATFSRRWTDLLRIELGFSGPIVSDALDMAAAGGDVDAAHLGAAAVRSLAAGTDLACLGSLLTEQHIVAVRHAVRAAARAGAIDTDQLGDAAVRIDALRRTAPRHAYRWSGRPSAASTDAAKRALLVVGALPAVPGFVVECRPTPSPAASNVRWGLIPHLTDGWIGAEVVEGDDVEGALSLANERPVVVVVRDLPVHRWQGHVIERVLRVQPGAVVVEMGWPSAEPPSQGWVVSHGASRANACAVAELLVGAPEAKGRDRG